MAVPLRKGEQMVGVLDIQSDQKNAFNAEDVAIIQAMADQSAIAIDNARLLIEQQNAIAALKQADNLNREYTRALENQCRY